MRLEISLGVIHYVHKNYLTFEEHSSRAQFLKKGGLNFNPLQKGRITSVRKIGRFCCKKIPEVTATITSLKERKIFCDITKIKYKSHNMNFCAGLILENFWKRGTAEKNSA
ncbi:MAG: hypothetical protein PVG48_02775 [Candidatus Bathyarchaeota archaeon]|jgi:hypothetical protein